MRHADDTMEVDPAMDETITIHGREFQKYAIENDIQYLPIDEEEGQRLVDQHRVLRRIFDSKLIFPPVNRPRRVLELGYGSATWAIELAEAHPDCKVTGIDISHQLLPDDAPDNFWPLMDNLNHVFNEPPNRYDLVSSRLVGAGIDRQRWAGYVRDIKKVLKPGGWCQMVEYYFMVQSDNGSLNALAPLKDPRASMQLQGYMREAGFTNVESKMIPVPLCGWPSEPREKRIGEMQATILESSLRSLSLYPLTAKLNMSIEEFDDLVGRATEEASQARYKAYFPLYVCIGQKAPS